MPNICHTYKDLKDLCASKFSALFAPGSVFISVNKSPVFWLVTQHGGWFCRGRDPEISHSISRQRSALSSPSYDVAFLKETTVKRPQQPTALPESKHKSTTNPNESIPPRPHRFLLRITFKRPQGPTAATQTLITHLAATVFRVYSQYQHISIIQWLQLQNHFRLTSQLKCLHRMMSSVVYPWRRVLFLASRERRMYIHMSEY